MSYLSPEALRDLTGLSQGAAQIRWLRENGIRHWVRVDGKPRVPVDQAGNPIPESAEGVAAAKMPPQPNFGALRAAR